MIKSNQVSKDELNKLVQEVMNDSYFLKAKNVFWTSFFWLKDHNKYTGIFADDIESFTKKVRKQSKAFILDNKNKQ